MANYIEATNVYESVKDIMDTAIDSFYHVIIIDKFGYIVYINNTYAHFLGKEKQDVLGLKVEEVIPRTKLYETLHSGEPSLGSLFEYEDGRSLVYNRFPIKSPYGEILGVIGLSSLNATEAVNSLYKEIQALKTSNILFEKQLKGLSEAPSVFDNIVGISPKIIEIKKILSRVTNSRMPILLTGETGCGKEVFATAIHNASMRKDAPFVKVNCAAIPRELLESELFGYETSTFSGAIKGGKAGKFELANGGSILLDEIEELPLDLQPKLLRVLQEYEVERIGSVKAIPLNVQVICCSNQDLYKMTAEKKFREDLLYRINVMEIQIPPLRERPEDIPLLCETIIEKINHKYKLDIAGINSEALEYLAGYSWPGNVRELEHVLERACVLAEGGVLLREDFDFFEEKRRAGQVAETVISSSSDNFFQNKGIAEKQLIEDAIAKCGGNRTEAAKLLGISRSLLYSKIQKYGI
ncbi:MAG: sigma 54-interacting transcriptional regulator [Firmicutes bacterium]|nr:sigma 54-interacting transcriptional regulator [Bacillota bacterium]